MSEDAKTRLAGVGANIARTAKLAGRPADDVALIAVSKTHDAPAIRPLLAAGQRRFGENRVQEAQGKWPALLAEFPGTELHLVGQLQSNKADDAVALFDAIHSVDRASLVAALAKAQDKAGKRPRCFIQVNIGSEPQKGGCAVGDIPSLIAGARDANLDLTGLMAVPPAEVEAAPYFALLAKLARDNGLDGLSMGMTGDYETAVMLGATHVRIGSALFRHAGMTPAAIIFDFDGVIVDSEVPANLALAECLTEIGLETSFEDALDRYCGHRWADCVSQIEGRLGHALPADFEPMFFTRATELTDRHLTAVCGIDAFLDRVNHLPLAIASSSEPEWIAHKLERVSLCRYFGDRLFSASKLERGKPHPDVYLHAAKGLGIAPEHCLAIEDSPIGATAAVAAGMYVVGLCAASHIRNREAHAETLRAVGVHRIAFGFDEISL